jgi:hypothetical protein
MTQVTQKIIHEYGFDTIDEYFDYILESRTNGQHKQARELFSDLSEQQQQDFLYYVGDFFAYEVEYDENGDRIDPVTEIKTYLKIK